MLYRNRKIAAQEENESTRAASCRTSREIRADPEREALAENKLLQLAGNSSEWLQ